MIQNVKNILEDPEEDINISIFNEIQKEVYTFLKRRYFKSFLSSQFYEEGSVFFLLLFPIFTLLTSPLPLQNGN